MISLGQTYIKIAPCPFKSTLRFLLQFKSVGRFLCVFEDEWSLVCWCADRLPVFADSRSHFQREQSNQLERNCERERWASRRSKSLCAEAQHTSGTSERMRIDGLICVMQNSSPRESTYIPRPRFEMHGPRSHLDFVFDLNERPAQLCAPGGFTQLKPVHCRPGSASMPPQGHGACGSIEWLLQS